MQHQQKAIYQYCEQWSEPVSPLLHELERETHLKTLAPQMLSGKLQGQLLALFSKLLRPGRILEIGTFTGYATICLAQGLAPDGLLHTIEANPELAHIIRKYLKKAGLEERVSLHIGDALQLLQDEVHGTFDLVFIDAGKQDYLAYYELIVDRVTPGGLILADNVLWSGKVATELRETDADTKKLHEFNQRLQADERVDSLLLPLRDGLLAARKRG